MGYANPTRLLSGLHTQGSNGTPTAHLTIPHGRYWFIGYMNTSTVPKCIMGWRDSLNVKMRITTLGKKWLAGKMGSNITTPTIKQPNLPTSSSWMQASQISTINLVRIPVSSPYIAVRIDTSWPYALVKVRMRFPESAYPHDTQVTHTLYTSRTQLTSSVYAPNLHDTYKIYKHTLRAYNLRPHLRAQSMPENYVYNLCAQLTRTT